MILLRNLSSRYFQRFVSIILYFLCFFSKTEMSCVLVNDQKSPPARKAMFVHPTRTSQGEIFKSDSGIFKNLQLTSDRTLDLIKIIRKNPAWKEMNFQVFNSAHPSCKIRVKNAKKFSEIGEMSKTHFFTTMCVCPCLPMMPYSICLLLQRNSKGKVGVQKFGFKKCHHFFRFITFLYPGSNQFFH